MDFKWEMQERIDAGMNPDEAYNVTRDSYASIYDNRDKFYSGRRDRVEEDEHGILHITSCDESCVCTCTCDVDCECKDPVGESVPFGDAPHRRWRS